MIAKIKYRLLKSYRFLFGYGYRGLKKIVRWCSNHQNYTGVMLDAYKFLIAMKVDTGKVSREEVKQYRARWRQLWPWVPSIFIKIFPPFSGVKSPDYVPKTLYYNLIEPLLNDVESSRSFADKNMYGRLIDPGIQPRALLRKMHGQYYDHHYNPVPDVDDFFSSGELTGKKYIIKPAIDSQGGKSIALLEGRSGHLWQGEQKISRQWLENQYKDNFLIQEYVRQHPFYAKLNESSLNTMRLYTYRSVKDNVIHFLFAMIRVGKPGALIDNISRGGKAIGLLPDGTLKSKTPNGAGEICLEGGGFDLGENVKAVGFDAVKEMALKIAATQYYSRIIGFDFCVDENEKVWLIELNNYDIGIDRIQKSDGPLFGEFTDEVIAYCKEKKKGFRYLIR
ncbi:MAG: sugar-transfer associated ATP-grasp domain-containing protein [Marinilabiliaceae bacterium]